MQDPAAAGWTPDDTQQRIIDTQTGRHLVLAPPGCGKTQILAERIRRAHAGGVAYGDMLCLTFTNRAARGMRDRIRDHVDGEAAADIFVGNVHRYCSRFLFENGLVPAESAVIDDDTTVSIIAMYMNEMEERVLTDGRRRRYYSLVMFFAHLMIELELGIPKPLRLHPECATRDDIAVMRTICRLQDRPFTAEAMADIYEHNDFYRDLVEADAFDAALRPTARQTLLKMRYAHAYTAYKRQNNLIDFEDLLLYTYAALRAGGAYRRYPWVQVDEVQDLNLLQLAIVDELTDGTQTGDGPTVMYLGDEQQAIFSFMGAKLQTLELLKTRCTGHIHHLGVNHRSPKYLVDLLNAYATNELGSDPDLLPRPQGGGAAASHELQLVGSDTLETEYDDVARLARTLAAGHDEETTAVIVSSNNDADTVSQRLEQEGMSHFKVSGTDLFATPEVKLLLAHLSVLANDRNFLAWSRLMKGMMVCQTNASARQFVHQLEARAISPTDLLDYEGTTCVQEFVRLYDGGDLVVFDTETTGLNVFEDDIVQIAAERIRQGKTVARFSVHIETGRDIPRMLGDIVNPIIEERRHQTLCGHAEALQRFLDFVGNDVLVGHNAEYDYRIMDYNLRRYLPAADWQREHPVCLDSLRLIRLLRPDLKAFKLKMLLRELQLEGENSHLADADVHATVSLLGYCRRRAQEMVDSQQEYLARPGVQERIRLLRRNYGGLFKDARSRLYRRPDDAASEGQDMPGGDNTAAGRDAAAPAVVAELQRFYDALRRQGWCPEVKKLDYILRFLADDIIDASREPSLKEQLDRHIMEMNTFKEADLCGSTTIADRLFVTTIHKAKGLEFDNVIVFDVVDGRIPNYYSEGNPAQLAEDARKLYVAMSRARRRLFIAYSRQRQVGRDLKPQRLSRFMGSVRGMFKE